MARRYFVYILTNRPRGVLYVEETNNVARRISEHRAKIVPGFTSKHGLILLVYVEEYASILEARAREHSLKRWRREWKFKLIEKDNPEWRDLTDDISFCRSPDAVQRVALRGAVHRRAGAVANAGVWYDPGSAQQRCALRRARETEARRDSTSR